jgi:peptide/nickel transport system permease protein|tara:strand:- start:15 stop:896 length:882 start_codon:yes stop_codon:yes gene_type:complete
MSTRTRNFKNFWNDFSESRVALISFFIFIVILFIAVFAPLVSPTDPYDLSTVSIMNSRLPPMSEDFAGNLYILGTDGAGRDMLSSLFYGLRISLGVGVFSGIVALVIGSSLGISAAFFRGKYEMFVMRIVDIQLSFPSILVALIILASFGKGVEKTIIALILVQWAYYARTARGTALVEMNKEYVDSARCMGFSNIRIMFKHILPNCMAPLIVVGTLQTAHAISLEATLSFLGLGLPMTEPSLGLLIGNGFEYMHSGDFWISIFPGVALLITVASINLVGDHLRDMFNPRLKK